MKKCGNAFPTRSPPTTPLNEMLIGAPLMAIYKNVSALTEMLIGAPLMAIYKNVFDVMLHLEAEWISKQNILIADTIWAEPGP